MGGDLAFLEPCRSSMSALTIWHSSRRIPPEKCVRFTCQESGAHNFGRLAAIARAQYRPWREAANPASSQRAHGLAPWQRVCESGAPPSSPFRPKVIWGVVKEKAKICEIPALAPHDLRRTCARLCHQAGGELEQIQFLLGHVSVQTTERYLGCKQRFRNAVNDRIGLEPDPPG
jgi:integrase